MRTSPSRLLGLLAILCVSLAVVSQTKSQTKKTPTNVKVYLTPTCGCCSKWVDHMKDAKFSVATEVLTDLGKVAERKRVPYRLQSCHTAVVGGYLVEGHVPADVVRQLLKEQPKIVGIAVPGMPIGSPGMEGPNPQPYSIVAFREDGSIYEFARR